MGSDRQRQLRDDEGVAKSPYGGAPRVTPFGILEGFADLEAAPCHPASAPNRSAVSADHEQCEEQHCPARLDLSQSR